MVRRRAGGKSPLSNELGGFAGKVLDYLTAKKNFMTSYTGVYQNSRRPLPPPLPLWNKCEGAGTVGCRERRKVGSECLRETSAGAEDVLVTLRFYFQECKPFLQIFTPANDHANYSGSQGESQKIHQSPQLRLFAHPREGGEGGGSHAPPPRDYIKTILLIKRMCKKKRSPPSPKHSIPELILSLGDVDAAAAVNNAQHWDENDAIMFFF